MTEDMQTESLTEVKVHKIIAGPFSASDDPDFDSDEYVDFHWIDALVEVDGQMIDITIAHSDFDEIYKIKKHLDSATVEPYIIGKI